MDAWKNRRFKNLYVFKQYYKKIDIVDVPEYLANGWMKGKPPRTEDVKKKIGNSNKGKANLYKGKTYDDIYGAKANEQRKSRSDAIMGIVRGDMSQEHKDKISLSNIGKSKPKSVCTHCGLEGASGIMQRWHFDNCRNKKDV